jgi:GNAT superfamily N-acetyltransferase
VEWHRGDYVISTDPARLDLDAIHRYLHQEAYWAKGIPRETMERSFEGSLVFGLYRGDAQAGFARVVTDRAVFAYMGDVFVLDEHRGTGLGVWLVESLLSHPDLQGLRTFILGTTDAHGLYERFGFSVPPPERRQWMTRSVLPAELYAGAG